MRAIVYTRTGGPDVLQLVERPDPEPAEGEVLVRVSRSGVNPTDWKMRRGPSPGQPLPFPEQVPGQDAAGVVASVGEGVDPGRVGERVWVWEAAWQRPFGTAQELVRVPAAQAVRLPDSAGFDLGASLGIPALTAHRCLTLAEAGPTRLAPGAFDGATVLVQGGAGAVGNAAIQLARWAGATVVTTVSSDAKAALAAAAGAHHVVNYRTQDVVAVVRDLAPDGVPVVVEVAPGQNAALDVAVLAPHGTVAVYANNGGDEVTFPVRTLMTTNARVQFVFVYTEPRPAKDDAVAGVSAAVAEGALRVGPEHGLPLVHLPLERAADAHVAVENGEVGKVLLDL